MAIELALSKGIDTQIKKLDRDYTVEDFTSKFPYAHTVPQIELDGEHIGGYQDLKDKL
jgi:glutaredoxin